MAKVNGNLQGATGSVGNTTYVTSGGQTIARQKVTNVKNPQTAAQTAQRVIIKQVQASYKAFKALCDHSFEGFTTGAKCMNQFMHLNARYLRRRAREIQSAGFSLYDFYQFSPISDSKWLPGAAIIADGSINRVPTGVINNGGYVGTVDVPDNTYKAMLDKYRLVRGDQLTFVVVVRTPQGDINVEWNRIILDPRTAEGDGAPMTTALIADGAVVNPSSRNKGAFSKLAFVNDHIEFAIGDGDVLASAIIVSRKDKDYWYRSKAQLVISEEAIGDDLCSLMEAMDLSYTADSLELDSELYLNNAGTGGVQGTDTSDGGGGITPVTPSADPTYGNTATFNGMSQSISGGAVNVTAPLNSLGVQFTNLPEGGSVTVKKVETNGTEGAAINPTSSNATSASWSSLSVTAGMKVRVYKADGSLWFSVNVNAAGGGGDDFDG